ncbi:uncharacterized protein LOC135937254 [Cloeon dipterum]|uniref:uncharacterized protein LOC135937254 n=1 Tax=Cloeon dipterum TaxID=197152 RepID=UPI00321FD6C3
MDEEKADGQSANSSSQTSLLYSSLMDFSEGRSTVVSMCNVSLADITAPSPEAALAPALLYQEPLLSDSTVNQPSEPIDGKPSAPSSSTPAETFSSDNEENSKTYDSSDKLKNKSIPENWIRNKLKSARLTGSEFINEKGDVIPARKTGNSCSCKMNCLKKTTNEEKDSMIKLFNSLQTKDAQDKYLQKLIVCRSPAQRKSKVNKVVRKHSFYYFIAPRGNKGFKVCKSAFCDYYGITVSRVDRICVLLSNGKEPEDLRGKGESANTVPDQVCWSVWDHISSFPPSKAYIPGKKTPILYLDAKLNVKKMYKMYSESSNQSVSYNFYRRYFLQHFNLTFGEPKSCITMLNDSE